MSNSTVQLAGRFRRLAATAADMILVPSLSLVLIMIAGVVEDAEDYANNWWALWVFLLAVLAYLILNGYPLLKRGQTLGKMLFGIMIVSSSGDEQRSTPVQPAPFWKLIAIRALFFPILFVAVMPWLALLPILDQMLIFGKRRRCLHDLAAGTQVIRRLNTNLH